MRLPRVYLDESLEPDKRIRLSGEQARHLSKVLRLGLGEEFIVFNGLGGEFRARVEALNRTTLEARVGEFVKVDRESPLDIILVQAISRGARMDFTVQKAVELGVHTIAPVTTERSVVRLDAARRGRRVAHWRSIAVSACQQCGRTRVPLVDEIMGLEAWLEQRFSAGEMSGLVLSPGASLSVDELGPFTRAALLIGAEGGLSDGEMAQVERWGFQPLSLGPRTLRTETAAAAALTALQLKYGDLSRRD